MPYPSRHRLPRSDNYADPTRPDYRPDWWRRSVEHWDRTLDWTGPLDDTDFKDYYLCRVAGELEPDRTTRLQATSPEPYFKDAVGDHSSIFTQFEIDDDAPQSLIDNQDNVDLSGSDLWQWASNPLFAFFRDGAAIVGVDMPPAQSEQDLRSERRPRLFWVPVRDIYWPEYRDFGGVSKLAKISIRRGKTRIRKPDNALEEYNEYWVYELDAESNCSVVLWVDGEEGKPPTAVSEPRPILAANGQPMKRLPLTDKLSFIGDLKVDQERVLLSPFADVLNLNIEHYNAKSELRAVEQKTALPTPVREWVDGVPSQAPPFYAGPGRCIDIQAGARVYYLELVGQSIPELRKGLADIERKIEARNNRLFHVGGNKSATEAEIENQKAKVGLPKIKAMVESAFQDVATVWELFANPSPQPVGGITISDQVLQSPPDAQGLTSTLQAVPLGVPIEAVIAKLIRDGHFYAEDFEGAQLPANPDEVIE